MGSEALTMAGEGGCPTLPTPNSIAHELMEEDLQRELARNEAATKMAMERELEARAAKKRAEDSQIMMNSMLAKYEEMRSKLDSTKKHLDETNSKITTQARLTEKIAAMKERVEAYAVKKEAVSALTEHVNIKQNLQQKKLEVVTEVMLEEDDDHSKNAQRLSEVKQGLKERNERMEILKENMRKNAETLEKREQLKAMLERQVEIEEKRTLEHNKIAVAREKLLQMKMKELELQKARLERAKREQEEKKRATNDFMASIEAELEDMEVRVKAPLVEQLEKQMGAVPKKGKSKNKGKKNKNTTPKVMSPEPKTTEAQDKKGTKMREEDEQEKGQIDAAAAKSERRETIIKKMEQMDKLGNLEEHEKMSEEEVREMVKNVEGKCETVRGDIANMAMSEQYLRTKQALLMAKKKEQEMEIASNIAAIREDEVIKMREKVKSMQDLLSSRKQKLKITEDILVEKSEEKKNMDKDMERMKRRENYVEKELIDRIVFDKEPPKKK